MKYLGFSTVLALALILIFIFVFYSDLQLPFYVVWLVSVGLTTFIFYWVDKQLAKAKQSIVRIPEHTLNLLTLAGGFVGAWVARGLFRHKMNIRKHRVMWVVLILSTLIHGALIYLVFFWKR